MWFEIWQFIIILILVILASAITTFFVTRKLFKKHLKENPPISEETIRIMMAQMGRTPSEKQVRAVMRSMNESNGIEDNKKDKKNKK